MNSARTIKTVGELKKILSYYADDLEIVCVENRYCGGGDEYHETKFVVAEGNGALIITPASDAGITGTLLDPDEL